MTAAAAPPAGTSFGRAIADPIGPPAATRVGTWLFLLFVLFVAFWDLGGRSLHNLDLARFGVLGREMVATGEWIVPTRYGEVYANKPPLMIWLIAAPATLVGEVSPFLVRVPCAIGLVLMVISTALWGQVRGRSVTAGRVAALLLLGTYLLTRLGREGRPDMLAAGLAASGAVLLDGLALGRGRRGDAVAAGVLLGLAVLAKGPPVLLVPAVVLLVPAEGAGLRVRLARTHPLTVLAVMLATVLLWLVPAWIHGGGAYVHELVFEQAATRVAGTANKLESPVYYFARLFDAGAPWTPLYLAVLVAYLVPAGRPRLGSMRSLAAAAWITLVVFTLIPTKHVRYVVGIFPLLALGIGHRVGLLLERDASPRWIPVLRLGSLGLLLSAGALLLASGRVPGAVGPMVGPALLLAVVGAASWRSTGDASEARRRFVGGLLVAVALWMSAYWVLRDRYRVRGGDAFNRDVAAETEDARAFFTLDPVLPDDVFHGAPGARLLRGVEDLPRRGDLPRLLVLARADAKASLDRARGETGRVLLVRRHGLADRRVALIAYGPK